MAKKILLSSKRLKIDNANTVLVAAIGIAAAFLVFTAVASKTLFSQYGYQNRVITAKDKARDNLKADLIAASNLVGSYKKFINTSQNVLGGDSLGTGLNDGNNAQVILDALPSQYDFPGLISTLSNILSGTNNILGGAALVVNSISGTDEQLTEGNLPSTSNPSPQTIPFEFSVAGTLPTTQTLINVLQTSIRPINIQNLTINADAGGVISTDVNANTYFQPGIKFTISSETVQ